MKGVPIDGYAKIDVDKEYIKLLYFSKPNDIKKLKHIIVKIKFIVAEWST